MLNEEEKRYIHVCEVCGKTEVLTPMEAHLAGWDYPPMIGSFGIVSPRTCPNCLMINTLWWALVYENIKITDLNDSQKETLNRILGEPASIEVPAD